MASSEEKEKATHGPSSSFLKWRKVKIIEIAMHTRIPAVRDLV